MPGDRGRLLRLLRGELTVEDCKAFLRPTWQDYQDAEDLDAYGGAEGRKRLERECLHRGAVRLLEAAETYHCRVRVDALWQVADQLDPGALPADFPWRLIAVRRRIEASTRTGPAPKRERDERIREAWHLLRFDPLSRIRRGGRADNLAYTEALALLAELSGRSPKAVERIIRGVDSAAGPRRRARGLDPGQRAELTTFLRHRARRFPQNRRQTSR